MDHPHIKRLLLFMMAVTAIPVHSMALLHANKKSHESLRLTRSATSNGSLDLTRESSVNNCYESTCVLNEQFCSESKQGCDMCRYDHGECTANWDCFEFCSDKKAEEICGGTEGSTETTGVPWWSYLILVIFIVSIIINIWFGIKRLRIWRKCSSKKRRKSDLEESEKDESSKMLPNSQENRPQMSNPNPRTTFPEESSAPPYTDNSTTQVQTHETEKKPKSDNEESEKVSTLANLDLAKDTMLIGQTIPLKKETLRMINENAS